VGPGRLAGLRACHPGYDDIGYHGIETGSDSHVAVSAKYLTIWATNSIFVEFAHTSNLLALASKEEQMNKVLLALVAAMVFCALIVPCVAEEKKVEIKDGVIYFQEKELPTVTLSKLTQKFPSDCPQELLGIKGKIFRGELKKQGRHVTYTIISYLIPLGYNADTKEMAVYTVQDKGYVKGYESTSVQGMLKGKFDAENGSPLHWVLSAGTDMMTQEYKLSFLKNGNLRIIRSDAFDGEYKAVGSLPEENQEK